MIRARTHNPDLDPTGRVPQHQLGKVDIGGTEYQLLNLGTWNIATHYVPGNLVSNGGTLYLAIAASNGQVPPNATYWQPFDETMYFLRADRAWQPPYRLPPPFFQTHYIATGTIPVNTPTQLDIGNPGDDVLTNDGDIAALGGIYPGTPDPFTGTYFSIDLASDPTKFRLNIPGFYLVSRQFIILAMDDGSMVYPNQYVMTVNAQDNGFPTAGFHLSPPGTTLAVSLGGTGAANDDSRRLTHSFLAYNYSFLDVQLGIEHEGYEGNVTQWAVDLGAVYLGPGFLPGFPPSAF